MSDFVVAVLGGNAHVAAGARMLSGVYAADLRDVPLAPGSMGPKVEAACRFAEETGGLVRLRERRRALPGVRR